MSVPMEIEVERLDAMRRSGEDHVLLDVREPWETDLVSVEGSMPIPMRMLPGRVAELPRDKPVVVMCHHGGRSAQVMMWLREQGFDQATNLSGGIDAWARRIDPDMRTY